MSQRKHKVAQRIKEEISDILQTQMRDPRIGFVTVTRVELTDDLRMSRIFYSVLGNEEQKREVKAALNSGLKYIRKLLGERVKLRYTPEIMFRFDSSPEYSIHMEQLFEEIREERRGREGNADEQGTDSGTAEKI